MGVFYNFTAPNNLPEDAQGHDTVAELIAANLSPSRIDLPEPLLAGGYVSFADTAATWRYLANLKWVNALKLSDMALKVAGWAEFAEVFKAVFRRICVWATVAYILIEAGIYLYGRFSDNALEIWCRRSCFRLDGKHPENKDAYKSVQAEIDALRDAFGEMAEEAGFEAPKAANAG